jgi:hypothetical protein
VHLLFKLSTYRDFTGIKGRLGLNKERKACYSSGRKCEALLDRKRAACGFGELATGGGEPPGAGCAAELARRVTVSVRF